MGAQPDAEETTQQWIGRMKFTTEDTESTEEEHDLLLVIGNLKLAISDMANDKSSKTNFLFSVSSVSSVVIQELEKLVGLVSLRRRLEPLARRRGQCYLGVTLSNHLHHPRDCHGHCPRSA